METSQHSEAVGQHNWKWIERSVLPLLLHFTTKPQSDINRKPLTHIHSHLDTRPAIYIETICTTFSNFPQTLYTLSICHMPCRSIVGLPQIHKCPKYIFPICLILFTHLPYSKHLVHASLPCLNPHCSFPITHSVPALTHFIFVL